jgi:hypothetical protein
MHRPNLKEPAYPIKPSRSGHMAQPVMTRNPLTHRSGPLQEKMQHL